MDETWVKVEGIPPKFLSWRVMMRVSTSLGIPIDVDWHEIFRSFYKVLKIKVAVRDVSKIPSSRLMEFGGRNYMLSLSVCHEPVGGEANEDGDDPDDEQNGDNGNKNAEEEEGPNDGGNKPMETEQSEKTPRPTAHSGGSGQKKAMLTPVGVSSAGPSHGIVEERVKSKILENPVVKCKSYRGNEMRAPEENIGIQLLAQFDSEADEDEEEVETVAEVMPDVTVKGKGKAKWGPVLATRMSNRIVHDGKSMIEKAKDLKKCKNLEKPAGMPNGCHNSFAVLNNIDLLHKAHGAGLSLGTDMDSADTNVSAIKQIEIGRIVDFRENNPDMFLPADIDISHEVSESVAAQSPSSEDSESSQVGENEEDLSPWVEVFSKKSSSKRKLVFRSNGSRPYMEHKRS
jgi:hypothetical protein